MSVEGKPRVVSLDYSLSLDQTKFNDSDGSFRLSYYPQKLDNFSQLLTEIFGEKAKHSIYGDFKPLNGDDKPLFYIHLIEKRESE